MDDYKAHWKQAKDKFEKAITDWKVEGKRRIEGWERDQGTLNRKKADEEEEWQDYEVKKTQQAALLKGFPKRPTTGLEPAAKEAQDALKDMTKAVGKGKTTSDSKTFTAAYTKYQSASKHFTKAFKLVKDYAKTLEQHDYQLRFAGLILIKAVEEIAKDADDRVAALKKQVKS